MTRKSEPAEATEGNVMDQIEAEERVLRRQVENEPLVPHIGGPYARAHLPPRIEDLTEWPLTDTQRKMVHSIRAHQKMQKGRVHAEAGEPEHAVQAFQAALLEVLRSEEPADVDLRRSATRELLRLIREEGK